MSREDLAKLLSAELNRAAEVLATLAPGSEEYDRTLTAVERLRYAERDIRGQLTCGTPNPTPGLPEEQTAPETPDEAEAAPDDTPQYSLVEVRAKMTAAKRKGIDVAAIITGLGYTNLSRIPEKLYPALLEKIEVG